MTEPLRKFHVVMTAVNFALLAYCAGMLYVDDIKLQVILRVVMQGCGALR